MNRQGFLGIDVSKGYADFILIDNNKHVVEKVFRLNDTPQEHKHLGKLIDQWLAAGLEKIFCGVESTGGYENNWYNYLQGLGQAKAVRVSRLNAKGVKGISDAALTRTVTDQVSAANIATYLVSFSEKIVYSGSVKEGSGIFKDGRSYYNYINMLQKQQVQIGNQLEKLLYQHFQEMLIYCRNGMPTWLLRVLGKYPGAATVNKAGTVRLQKIKGISEGKAAGLLKKAQSNSQSVSEVIGYTISSMAMEMINKEEQIQMHKSRLAENFTGNKEVMLLDSVPGIATYSAVGLMIEIENISRFETCRQFCSFFGVHPTFKESGDGKWGSHMSKKGRPAVRKILYMSAMSAIRCEPSMKQLYSRHRSSGFNHYQAMGVVMHKLLRMIYGILKNQSAFNITTDQANREKAAKKQEEKELENKQLKKQHKENLYRFQGDVLTAPISRQKAAKIKKQTTSQT